MSSKIFLLEKNGYKVYKLTVHFYSYFIIEGNGKRYIRKSMNTVNQIIG